MQSEESYRQALNLDDSNAEAHYNQGNVLRAQSKLELAIGAYERALVPKSDFFKACDNLGNTFMLLKRFSEAENAYKKLIKLLPMSPDAHFNLGTVYLKTGNLKEATYCFREVISLQPDSGEAHLNLGAILLEFGRMREAEVSLKQAVAFIPESSEAYFNLGICQTVPGNEGSGLKSLKTAHELNPNSDNAKVLLNVLSSRVGIQQTANSNDMRDDHCPAFSSPFITDRGVEDGFVSKIYEMDRRPFDDALDPRFGACICSPDFHFLELEDPLIHHPADDLIKIMMDAVKSQIYIHDSFFNILKKAGGIIPYRHLSSSDKISKLNLSNQNFSFVYYLRVGHQNCGEPGTLKLYDPDQNIFSYEGFLTINPAN